MNGEVDQKLKETVEDVIGKSCKWIELEKGLNTIYKLSTEKNDFMLKIRTNPKNKLEWFKAEPRIYDIINEETNIPSPNIVHTELSQEKHGEPFYIMECLPGETPENLVEHLTEQDLMSILRQYGRILSKIHNVQVSDEFGIQGFSEGSFSSSEPNQTWSRSLEGAMSSWKHIIQDEWDNHPDLDYDPESIKEAVPDHPEPVLVHDDNRLDNILVRGDEISGFIDWSTSWTGHRYYDLVRAKYLLIEWDLEGNNLDADEERLENALVKGYMQNQALKLKNKKTLDSIYRFASTLWLAAGFVNWGQNLDPDVRQHIRQNIADRVNDERNKMQRLI